MGAAGGEEERRKPRLRGPVWERGEEDSQRTTASLQITSKLQLRSFRIHLQPAAHFLFRLIFSFPTVRVRVCVCECVFTARSFLCLFESTATRRSSTFFIYFFAEEREREINSLFTHKLVRSVWTGSKAAGQTRTNAVDSFNVCAKCL